MGFKERLKRAYLRIVKAHDTPHRIALGFGIGVFYGLFPFIGVIFTLVTAIIFKANKASALVGCFVTNTWMSFILALPSVKIGAKLFGLDYRAVWEDVRHYLKLSNIKDIFKEASGDVIIPSVVGFLVIAFIIAVAGYFVSLFLILRYKGLKAKE